MKRFALTVGVALAAGLTLVSGVIYGRMRNRWGSPQNSLAAAKKLESFPSRFGKWQLASSQEMSQTAIDMLECTGYFSRTYANQETGETVNVAIILGPAGPISVHTPEICYDSRGHRILQTRRPVAIGDSRGSNDRFWALTFQKNDLHADLLRVYYAWSTGGRWSAPEGPRYTFAGYPYLYKIQLACRLPAGTNVETSDPCRRFLEDFAPVAKNYLIDCSGND